MKAQPRVKFQPGDRVLVGRGGFGRPSVRATVAAEWDGESLVMVLLEGKSKPVPRAASQLRHEHEPAKRGPSLKTVRAPRKAPPKAKLSAVPKPAPAARSAPYLAFVRAHVCAACQRPCDAMEAHHWAPKRAAGRKVSDYRTVPLCLRCHKHFHDTGRLPELDIRTTREVFVRAQAALMDEWLSRESRRRSDAR